MYNLIEIYLLQTDYLLKYKKKKKKKKKKHDSNIKGKIREQISIFGMKNSALRRNRGLLKLLETNNILNREKIFFS